MNTASPLEVYTVMNAKLPFSAVGRTLAALVAAFLFGAAANCWAAPQGAQVVHGNVQIAQQGAVTTIQASHNAIINYQSFNIAAHETVRFIQPSATARVLNRDYSGTASLIHGNLQANGIVYLANPAGVFFGNTAVVNVGGLYAAAGSITNADFLANIDHFTNLQGQIVNNGTISAGLVHLLGQRVVNHGTVFAEDGIITMVAGQDVLLGEKNGHVLVKIDGAAAQPGDPGVENTGTVNAGDHGQVFLGAGDMYSMALSPASTVRADQVTVQGGAGSTVHVAGTLDASNNQTAGGSVTVLGQEIALYGAYIDTTGLIGGGQIHIGGSFQGAGPLPNASSVYVDSTSVLRADATGAGNAGQIIVWADGSTAFHGIASAQATGPLGNGGFIEISGADHLLYTGSAPRAAANGTAGTLWLDPGTVNIISGGDNDDLTDNITTGTIIDELNSGDLTISTVTNGSAGPQNLNINGALTYTSANKLTLIGASAVNVNSPVTNNGTGDLEITGTLIQVNAALTTNGGILSLTGAVSFLGDHTVDATTGQLLVAGSIDANGNSGTLTAATVTIPSDLALNGGSLTVSGNGGADSLTVNADASGIDFLLDNASGLTIDGVSVGAADFETLTLNGNTGNDTLTVNNTGADPMPATALTFAAGDGTDSITLTNASTSATFTFDNANDGNLVRDGGTQLDFTGVESIDATGDTYNTAAVTFSAGTGNTITLGDDGADDDGNLRIAGGAGPQLDLPTPTGGAATLTINTGGGDDSLTISDLDTNGGTDFNADLVVNGQGGDDTLTIDYSAGGSPQANAGKSVTFNGGTQTSGDALVFTGGSPTTVTFDYTDANSGAVNVDGATFNYTGLEPLTFGGTASDLVFNLPDGALTATLENATGAGQNQLTSTAFENTTFANPSNSLTVNLGTGGQEINQEDMDAAFAATVALNGNTGADTFDINGTANVPTLNLDGAGGDDTFSLDDGVTVNNITGGAGTDELTYADHTGPVTVDMQTNSNSTGVAGSIATVETFTGSAHNGDIFQGADADIDWEIDATPRYDTAGTPVNFSAFEQLRGGSGADDFVFGDGVTFTGAIDGNAGSDSLTFSAVGQTVNVTLTGSAANGFTGTVGQLTGGFVDIDAVTAGTATDDTLTGSNNAATWHVEVGANQYQDTDNTRNLDFANFEQLTGNAGADTFEVDFGSGNPITAAGLTVNGEGGSDALDLVNVGAGFATHTYTFTGTASGDGHDGSVDLDGSTITFTGLEPITNDGTATDIVFNLPDGSGDDATLQDAGIASDGNMELVDNAGTTTFEDTTFVVPTGSLTINGRGGADSIEVASFDNAWNSNDTDLTLSGGDDDDTLTLDTTSGAGTFTLNGNNGDDTIEIDAIAAASTVNVNGGSGDDTIDVANIGSSGTDLDDIAGTLTVIGGSGGETDGDELFLDDSAQTAGGRTYTIDGDANTISDATTNPITVDNTLELLSIAGTDDPDNGDGDTFAVVPSAAWEIDIEANDPTGGTGDTLAIDVSGFTNPGTFTWGSPYDGNGGSGVIGSASGEFQDVSFTEIETLNMTGLFDLVIDSTVVMGAGGSLADDGTADTINVQLDASDASLLAPTVDPNSTGATALLPKFPIASANSLTILGSGDDDLLNITENASGLPSFQNEAPNAHHNNAFDSSAFSGDVGIHFDGNGGTDSLSLTLLSSLNTGYYPDDDDTANSGLLGVQGAFNLAFEQISPLTLSGAGGTLTVDASSAPDADTFILNDSGGPAGQNILTIDDTAFADADGPDVYEDLTFSGYDTLTVKTGGGADSVTVTTIDTADPAGPGQPLLVVNLSGENTGETDTSNETFLVTNLPANVALTLDGGRGNDSFTIRDTDAGSTVTINGGLGNDDVDIDPLSASSDTIAGDVTVNGDSGDDTVDVAPTDKFLDNIDGLLDLDGGSGDNTLTVDASEDNGGLNGTITASAISGFDLASGITYTQTDRLVLTTGDGADTINITGSGFAGFGGNDGITLVTGDGNAGDGDDGNDTITVTLGSLAGTVDIDATTGTDSLTVNGTAAAETIAVNTNDVRLDPDGTPQIVQYDNIEDLAVNTGANSDTLRIDSPVTDVPDSVTLTTTGGTITDNNGTDPDIQTADLVLEARSGIATIADPLETVVSNVDFYNSTSNEVGITNDVGGLLTVTDLGLANHGSGSTGGSVVINTSPLTIDTSYTFAGNATFTAGNDTASGGDDVTIANSAVITINSANDRTLQINAGDDIHFNTGRIVTTGGGNHTVDLNADTEGDLVTDSDGGTIFQTGTATSVTTQVLDMTAPDGIGSSSRTLLFNTDELLTDSSGNDGNQFLQEVDGLSAFTFDANDGNVHLLSGGNVSQDGGDSGDAAGLSLTGTGAFNLLLGDNDVETLAATITGSLVFANATDAGRVTVGAVTDGETGITITGGAATLTADGWIVDEDISAVGVSLSGRSDDAVATDADTLITINPGQTINANSGDLTLTGEDMAIDSTATLDGTAQVFIQPVDAGDAIVLGDTNTDAPTDDTLELNDAELATLSEGFTSDLSDQAITIGRLNGTHDITVTSISVLDDLAIRSPVGGTITVASGGASGITTRSSADAADINLIGYGDPAVNDNDDLVITVNNDLLTRNGSITVALDADADGAVDTTAEGMIKFGPDGNTVTLDSVGTGTGADITVRGGLSGTGASPGNLEWLVINAGTGTITVPGPLNPGTGDWEWALVPLFSGASSTIPPGNYYGNPVFTADDLVFPNEAGGGSITPVASPGSDPDLNFVIQPQTVSLNIGVENDNDVSALYIDQADIDDFADGTTGGFSSLTIGRFDGTGTLYINETGGTASSGGATANVVFDDPVFFRMGNGNIVVADGNGGAQTGGFFDDATLTNTESAANFTNHLTRIRDIDGETAGNDASFIDNTRLDAAFNFLASPNTTQVTGRVETDGVPITYLSDVELTGDAEFVTTGTIGTGRGSVPAGASIRFVGELDGTNAGLEDVIFIAGTGGNLRFENTVGGNKKLGNVLVSDDDAGTAVTPVNDIVATNNFTARSVTQDDGQGNTQFLGDLTTTGNANVADTDPDPTLGHGGVVDLTTTGSITLAGTTTTSGGIAPNTGSGDPGNPGGNVTLTGGTVSVGAIVTSGSAAESGGGAVAGGNAGSVTIDADGANPQVTLNGNITAVGGSGANGGAQGAGGNVTVGNDATGGTDEDAIALGSTDVAVTTGATTGDILFDGTFDGNGNNLTLTAGTGNVNFGNDAGDLSDTVDNLTKLTVVSAVDATFNGKIDSDDDAGTSPNVTDMEFSLSGDLLFRENVTLADELLVNTAVNVTVADGKAVSAGNITQTAGTDTTTFGGIVTTSDSQGIDISTERIVLKDDVTAGSGGSITLNIDTDDSAQNQSTAGDDTLVVQDGADITLNGGGSFTQGGGDDNPGDSSSTYSVVQLGGNVVTAGGNISFADDVRLDGNSDNAARAEANNDTDANLISTGTAGGNISFSTFVFANTQDTQVLILNGGDGNITITGRDPADAGGTKFAVGSQAATGDQRLADFIIRDANTTLIGGSVDTVNLVQEDGAGNTTFQGAVTVTEAATVPLHTTPGDPSTPFVAAFEINTTGTLRLESTLTADNNASGGGNIVMNVGDVEFVGGNNSISADTNAGTNVSELVIQTYNQGGSIGLGSETGNMSIGASEVDAIAEGFQHIFIGRHDGTGSIRMNDGVIFKDPVFFRSPESTGLIAVTGNGVVGNDDGSVTDGPAYLVFDAPEIQLGGNIVTKGTDVYFINGAALAEIEGTFDLLDNSPTLPADLRLGNSPAEVRDGLANVTITQASLINTDADTALGADDDAGHIVFEDTIVGNDTDASLIMRAVGDAGDGGRDGDIFVGALGGLGVTGRVGGAGPDSLLGTADDDETRVGPISIVDARDVVFQGTVSAVSFEQQAGSGDTLFHGTTAFDPTGQNIQTSLRTGGFQDDAAGGGTVSVVTDGVFIADGAIISRGGRRVATEGDGFDGGAVDITAEDIEVRLIDTSGGDANVSGDGGNAGAINLDATDTAAVGGGGSANDVEGDDATPEILLHGDLVASGGDRGDGDDGSAADVTVGDTDGTFDDMIELDPEAGTGQIATADTITVEGNDVDFYGPVNADTAGADSLIVDTFDNNTQVPDPFGVTTFHANVGNSTALENLFTDSFATPGDDGNGRTEFDDDAALINVTDTTQFNDPVRVVRGDGTTFRGDNAPTDAQVVRFNSLLDSDVDGTTATDVTINATLTEFNDLVGSLQPLDTLLTTDGSGPDTTVINHLNPAVPASPATSITAATVQFNDPVEIHVGSAATPGTATVTGTTAVNFYNTVDGDTNAGLPTSQAAEANNLVVATGSGGNIRFGEDGASGLGDYVGSNQALGDLTVDQADNGTTFLHAGNATDNTITTEEDILFGGAVRLGADTTIVGNDVTFAATGSIDSQSGELNDLTVNTVDSTRNAGTAGNTFFNGPIGVGPDGAVGGGDDDPLASLTTDDPTAPETPTPNGTTSFGGQVVLLNGASMDIYDPAVLTADLTVTELGTGNVTFHNTLDDDTAGEHNLVINTDGLGDTVFIGAVGGTTPLGSILTDADGTTIVRGGLVATSDAGAGDGSQTFNDPVEISAASSSPGGGAAFPTTNGGTTTFTGVDITFAQTIDAWQNGADGDPQTLDESLTVTATGNIDIQGDIGSNNDTDGTPDDQWIQDVTLSGVDVAVINIYHTGSTTITATGTGDINGDDLSTNDTGTAKYTLIGNFGLSDDIVVNYNHDGSGSATGIGTGAGGEIDLDQASIFSDDAFPGSPFTLTLMTASTDAAGGPVALGRFYDNSSANQFVNQLTVNTSGSNATPITGNSGTTTLTANIELDNDGATPGDFVITGHGDVVIADASPADPLVVDTENGNDADGGAVNWNNSNIFGDGTVGAGQALVIDTASDGNAGGAVDLGLVDDNAGSDAFLNTLVIDTQGTGGTAGVTTLDRDVFVDDDGAGQSALVAMDTDLRIDSSTDTGGVAGVVEIDTETGDDANGGAIDLGDALDGVNNGVNLDNVDASTLSGANADADLTLRTAVGGSVNGGDVRLGDFSSAPASGLFVKDLRIETAAAGGTDGTTSTVFDINVDDNGGADQASVFMDTLFMLLDDGVDQVINIDTEQDGTATSGTAGWVDLQSTTTFADVAGLDLNINTSATTGDGGPVDLGLVNDLASAQSFLNDLTVTTGSGDGNAGTMTLHDDVSLDDDGSGDTGDFTYSAIDANAVGLVVISEATGVVSDGSQLLIRTEQGDDADGGNVLFGTASIAANAPGETLKIDTHSDNAGGSGGNVSFGDVDDEVGVGSDMVPAGRGGRLLHRLEVDTSHELATGGGTPGTTTLDDGDSGSNDTRLYTDPSGGPGTSGIVFITDLRLADDIDIDTELTGVGTAGADGGIVDMGEFDTDPSVAGIDFITSISATETEVQVAMDTSTSAAANGGNVSLGKFDDNSFGTTDHALVHVDDLTITTADGVDDTPGSTTFHANVELDDTPGNPGGGDLEIIGDGNIIFSTNVDIDTNADVLDDGSAGSGRGADEGGSVIFHGSSLSADDVNFTVRIFTGADSQTTGLGLGGAVQIHTVNNDGGAYISNLLIDTRGVAAADNANDGIITITGGSVTTQDGGDVIGVAGGDQAYRGPIVLDSAVTVGGVPTTTFTGNDIWFGQTDSAGPAALGATNHAVSGAAADVENTTINSADRVGAEPNEALVVNTENDLPGVLLTGTEGTTLFGGKVGLDRTATQANGTTINLTAADNPLDSVTTNVNGTTFIGADINTVGGTQTYNDPALLSPVDSDAIAANAVSLSDTGTTGIRFFNTLDTDSPTYTDVDLNLRVTRASGAFSTPTNHGSILFGDSTADVVGGTARLGDVTVLDAWNVVAEADFTARSFTQGQATNAGPVVSAGRNNTIFNKALVVDGIAGDVDGGDVQIVVDSNIVVTNVSANGFTGGDGGDIYLIPGGGGATAEVSGGEPMSARVDDDVVGGILWLRSDPATPDARTGNPGGLISTLGGAGGADGTVYLNVNDVPASEGGAPTRDGRDAVPIIATIVGTNSLNENVANDYRINAGRIIMGQNEKATFFGSAFFVTDPLDGLQGHGGQGGVGPIYLSDVNTYDDLYVIVLDDGPGGAEIYLRQRDKDDVREFTGLTVMDFGLDFFSGDLMGFNVVPTLTGTGGDVPVIFASPGADHDLTLYAGNLSPYINRDFGTLDIQFFTSAVPAQTDPFHLANSGTAGQPVNHQILDLTAEEPSNANVSEALAGAIPRPHQAGDVLRDTLPGTTQRDLLRQIGYDLQSLGADELLAFLSGRAMYNDVASDLRSRIGEGHPLTRDRLTWDPVTAVIATYTRLFLYEEIDETTGEPVLKSRHVVLRNALTDAYKGYMAQAKTFDPQGFRGYIEAGGEKTALALETLDGLRELFRRLAIAGLSPAEIASAKATVLPRVLPEGMSVGQLDATVNAPKTTASGQ